LNLRRTMATYSSAINQNLSAEREDEEESARYANIVLDNRGDY